MLLRDLRPGIPWAVIELAWRHTLPLECPNGDEPTILAAFGWKRVSFLGFQPRQEFVCVGCRRRHVGHHAGIDEQGSPA